jgi:hypothetical protein
LRSYEKAKDPGLIQIMGEALMGHEVCYGILLERNLIN